MSSINFNIRMDEQLKARAFPVIESYGLTPAQAVKLFFHQIADTHALPLSFNHNALLQREKKPNATTIAAMEEVRLNHANGVQGYDSIEELMQAIQEWQE